VIILSGSAVRSEPPLELQCTLQLNVTLTPDIPDATNPGFLSSLIGNHVSYRLFLLQQLSSTDIVVDLTGPGPAYLCGKVIDAMSRDARVQSIQVANPSES
jgi:hypothetical protein